MELEQFLRLLDELMELPPGTVKGTDKLSEQPRWDSVAVLGFVAMADEKFGTVVDATELSQCTTAGELARLLEGKVVL